MIKVNLLEGTAEQRVTMQRTKVAARRGQQLFMLFAALIVFAIAIGGDALYTNKGSVRANVDLEREKVVEKQLQADLARKEELENDIKQVDERNKVIKQLRAEQKGPVAMLSAINERIPSDISDFSLETILQKESHLELTGSTTTQLALSEFVRRLEFSDGLFTNVSFSIIGQEDRERKVEATEEPLRKFQFKISCDYNKPRDASVDEAKQASQPPAKS